MIGAAARESLRTAGILLAFAVGGTALLAYTHFRTDPIITASEEQARTRLLTDVLGSVSFDNELLRDMIELPPSPELGTLKPAPAYRARRGGQVAAVVLQAVAPDGYSGRIRLLVGIRADGELTGVRVLSHHETPGLGDYVEIARSEWIRIFENKSLASLPAGAWKVRKDGGEFDYVVGATVTPRAVIKAVRKALQYYEQNRGRLLDQPGEGAKRSP